MNKLKRNILSLLSSFLVFSNSIAYGTTNMEVIYDGKKVEFDVEKLNKAKELFNQVNDRFGETKVKLMEIQNDLKNYGINSDYESYYKVMKVLKDCVTLNYKSIEYVKKNVNQYFGTFEVDFVAKNYLDTEKIYNYIRELEELSNIHDIQEKEKKRAEIEKKYDSWSISENPIYLRRCMQLLGEVGTSNGGVGVLKSCHELQNVPNIENILDRIVSILVNSFNSNSYLCANTLLPKLETAMKLQGETFCFKKVLDHDLDYWFNNQFCWYKRFGNFVLFKDTSIRGKADRAIDNYISDMEIVLGKKQPSSTVGLALFMGTVIFGGVIYYVWCNLDTEEIFLSTSKANVGDAEGEDFGGF